MSTEILHNLLMDDKIFVQSIGIQIKLPNGKVVTGKFTGLAMCSPAEWKELTEQKSLGEALHGEMPITFTQPKPLDDMIDEDSDKHDIIDSIREELRRDHHEDLKE